jgi:putative oxidoreductase
LLWHGLPKLLNPASATEKFVNWGFPGILAPIVGVLEVGAALLILVGYLIPVAVVVAGSIIIVALLTVQIPKGSVHAALERDTLILITMMILLAFGPGRFALADRLPQLSPFSRGTQG